MGATIGKTGSCVSKAKAMKRFHLVVPRRLALFRGSRAYLQPSSQSQILHFASKRAT